MSDDRSRQIGDQYTPLMEQFLLNIVLNGKAQIIVPMDGQLLDWSGAVLRRAALINEAFDVNAERWQA